MTVTAEDDDAVDDEVTLAHTASGGDYGSVTEDLPVTVDDGDTVGLVVDPAAVTVDEADDPATPSIAEHKATYTVKLASEPSATVTVGITGHAGSDLTLDKESLTFAVAKWNEAQTVTVTAGGRRRCRRRGDAGAHGVGRRLRVGDGGSAGDGGRRRHGGAGGGPGGGDGR